MDALLYFYGALKSQTLQRRHGHCWLPLPQFKTMQHSLAVGGNKISSTRSESWPLHADLTG
ncbi:hypothetical protein HAX54_048456, partial [Datura stramonium]|nr:hypothetical protein [Datura stramonium]